MESVSVENFTNSTSPYNGAVTTLGGIGVSLDVNIGGILSSTKKCDKYIKMPSSTTLLFDMNVGMNYLIPIRTSTFTSITFANIPLTTESMYDFQFLIQQPLKDDLYYLKPPLNTINIVDTDLTMYQVVCYGISNVNLPISKDYILQKITIINRGTSTVPIFMASTSVYGY